MIIRFKWCACSVFALSIQFGLLSVVARAALPDTAASAPVSRKVVANSGSGAEQYSRLLSVKSVANREFAAPGEAVTYELTVINTSKDVADNLKILDVLPAGFKIVRGSVQINGVNSFDPVISAGGQSLSFAVGTLAAERTVTINFEAEIVEEVKRGKAINYASAISSNGSSSNVAKAVVLVKGEFQPAKPIKKAVVPANILPVVVPPVAPPEISSSTPIVALTSVAELPVPPTVPSAVKPVPTSPEQRVEKKIQEPVTVVVAAAILPEPKVEPKVEAAAQASGQTPDSTVAEVTPKESAPAALIANGLVIPKAQNLSELVGKTEITVLADVDGQFVRQATDNRLFDKENAIKVTAADLTESVRAGRSFSRDSLAAMARTDQAKAQTGQSFGQLLPSVSLHVNTGLETSDPAVSGGNSDAHSRTDASLTARQPLFDLPTFKDWQRRKVIEQARGESYRVSDGDSYLAAVNAYLALVASRLQTDMTREFETQLNELLVYVEKRANAGAASNSDMSRVRARSQATLSSRLEQEAAHAAAGIEFVRLTNLVPGKVRLPSLEDVGLSLLPKSVDSAVISAMTANPEISSLSAELQAAQIDQEAAKGRYYPRVDAEYTNSLSLHAGGDTSSAGQRDQRLMMVLNWNLYSGGSDSKNHVERVARHRELQYRLDDQRRRVIQTMSANYATLATTQERIVSGYQELKSISSAADAMSKRMLSGNQSLLDLLDVYDRYYQVRSRLVSLHILEMNTVAQLVRLTRGTPDTPAQTTAGSVQPDVKGGAEVVAKNTNSLVESK